MTNVVLQLVQKYKKVASPLLKKKLDWEAPKLVMKLKIVDSNNEMLIIAADRKGKFNGLRYMEIPEGVKGKTSEQKGGLSMWRATRDGRDVSF